MTDGRRVRHVGRTVGRAVGQTCCHGIVRAMHMRRAVKIADMLSGVGIIPTCDGRTDRRANGQVYRLIYEHAAERQTGI